MQMIFTEQEREWMDTKTFGLPIKKGCPEKVRKSIEKKKKIIKKADEAMENK